MSAMSFSTRKDSMHAGARRRRGQPQKSLYRPRFEALEERTLLAAGALDASFGIGGLVSTDFGGSDGAVAAALQDDGKIVVAGFASPPPLFVPDFALARY